MGNWAMRRLTRREFLRDTAVVAGGAYLLSGPLGWACRAEEAKILSEIGWAGRNDPLYIRPFEEKYNVKHVYKDTGTPPEMTAIVSTAPAGTYDVLNTNASETELLVKAGLLEELNPDDYPLEDFWPEHRPDKFPQMIDGKIYFITDEWGYNGIVYNTKYVKSEPQSWQICWDPALKGHVGMWDSWQHHMLWVGLLLGHKVPYDISDAQLKEIGDTLISLKPQLVAIVPTFGDVITNLANESFWLYPSAGTWCSYTPARQGVPLKFTIPREGCLQWSEGVSILKSSKRKDLARKYSIYMAGPEAQAGVSQKKGWVGTPANKEAWKLLDPEFAKFTMATLDVHPNLIDLAKGRNIVELMNPRRQPVEKWIEEWSRFKAA